MHLRVGRPQRRWYAPDFAQSVAIKGMLEPFLEIEPCVKWVEGVNKGREPLRPGRWNDGLGSDKLRKPVSQALGHDTRAAAAAQHYTFQGKHRSPPIFFRSY